MMYIAKVKWNGNHYLAGEEVRGSKIRKSENGVTELFDDDEPTCLPFRPRNEWVEVEPESVKEEKE